MRSLFITLIVLAPTLASGALTKETVLPFLLSEKAKSHALKIASIDLTSKTPLRFEGDSKTFQALQREIQKVLLRALKEDFEGLLTNWQSLTQKEQETLLFDYMNRQFITKFPRKGDLFPLAFDFYGLLLSRGQSLKKNVDHAMAHYPHSPKVYWLPDAGRFEFQDKSLFINTYILAYHLIHEPQGVKTLLLEKKDPKKRIFLRNSHTTDPRSLKEPFDLLQHLILALLSESQDHRLALTTVIHKRLFELFELTPDEDPRGAHLDKVLVQPRRGKKDYLLMAACSQFKLGHTVRLRESFLSLYQLDPKVHYSHYGPKSEILCDGQRFLLQITPQKKAPLPYPKDFHLADYLDDEHNIDVLVTYALTPQTKPRHLRAFSLYLKTKGFKQKESPALVETRPQFAELFTRSDLLIPVAHTIDIYEFDLGAQWSEKRVYEKKNHEGKKATVTVLFPKGGGPLTLDMEDLGGLFSKRRSLSQPSLVTLIASCYSKSSVVTWSMAFRKGVELDIKRGAILDEKEAIDMVHAIAANGSFPTSTLSGQLLSFAPALKTLELFLQNKPPHLILEELKTPFTPKPLIRFIAFGERFFKRQRGGLPKTLRFQPIYNLTDKEVLKASGYELRIEPIR